LVALPVEGDGGAVVVSRVPCPGHVSQPGVAALGGTAPTWWSYAGATPGSDVEAGAAGASDATEPATDRSVSASPPPDSRAMSSGVAPRASAAQMSGAGLAARSRRITAADWPAAALWSGVCPSESQAVTEARCERSKRHTCQPATSRKLENEYL
jgi:hypothetical protein